MTRTFTLQPAVYSALRKLFRRWPGYKEVLDRCKEEYFIKSKHGKDLRRVRFKCEKCSTASSRKQFAVDHIEPVVPIEGIQFQDGIDYNTYIERLFCPVENLQGLCKTCHDEKTKQENADRRKYKKALKEAESTATERPKKASSKKKRAKVVAE